MRTAYRFTFTNILAPRTVVFATDDFLALTYTFNTNDATELALTLPYDLELPALALDRGTLLKVWRKPQGMNHYSLEGETEWLLGSIIETISNDGAAQRTLTFMHPNTILKRRIVAYPQSSEQADKTIDNGTELPPGMMMLAFVKENLGENCADSERIVAGLLYDYDTYRFGNFPATECSAPWRNLLSTLQDITSERDGHGKSTFNLTLLDGVLTWRMAYLRLGSDLSASIAFSLAAGNVSEVTITTDYANEINVCYAGGDGSGEDQLVAVLLADNILSPLYRSEDFQNFTVIEDDSLLAAEGRRFLDRNRARKLIKAKLLDAGAALYGRDYRCGDAVSLRVGNTTYKADVYAVTVNVDDGAESVDVYLEAEAEL